MIEKSRQTVETNPLKHKIELEQIFKMFLSDKIKQIPGNY